MKTGTCWSSELKLAINTDTILGENVPIMIHSFLSIFYLFSDFTYHLLTIFRKAIFEIDHVKTN